MLVVPRTEVCQRHAKLSKVDCESFFLPEIIPRIHCTCFSGVSSVRALSVGLTAADGELQDGIGGDVPSQHQVHTSHRNNNMDNR